jgi:hypothetical protein
MLAKIERYFYARERTILDIGGSVVRKSVQPYIGPNVPYEQHDVRAFYWLMNSLLELIQSNAFTIEFDNFGYPVLDNY